MQVVAVQSIIASFRKPFQCRLDSGHLFGCYLELARSGQDWFHPLINNQQMRILRKMQEFIGDFRDIEPLKAER